MRFYHLYSLSSQIICSTSLKNKLYSSPRTETPLKHAFDIHRRKKRDFWFKVNTIWIGRLRRPISIVQYIEMMHGEGAVRTVYWAQ